MCGILCSSNKGATHASALLSDDPDTYFISPCDVEKWVIVQLSAETIVRRVTIVNYEFYSSTTKRFELLGSLRSARAECVPKP